jgi:hypothetical protein
MRRRVLVTIEERVNMEAEKLSGPEIGKKIRTKKVLTYVMTTLGGTFIEQLVEEEEDETA